MGYAVKEAFYTLQGEGVRAGRAAAGRETTDENLRIIPVEPEAVDCALKLGRRDDLVVILGDDLLRCWEQISAARRG